MPAAAVSLLVTTLLVTAPGAQASGQTAAAGGRGFQVVGSQIMGPDGKQFIPVGANVNGPHFVWNGQTIGQAQVASEVWHWNTVRLDTGWPGGVENGGGWDWDTNNDLDAIVSQYSNRNIVVMIDLQQFMPGQFPSAAEMTEITAWWKDIANRFKGNPYVWFNLLNEPGNGGQSALPEWYSVTSTLAQAIRGTGAQNIIVADGSQYGQEAYDWGCGEIPYANSAILTYGQQLQANFGNMLFSLHTYSEWGGGSQGCSAAQLDNRLGKFIDRVHAQALALVIGETGTHPKASQEEPWEKGQTPATHSTFRVAPRKGVGILPWHGDQGAGYLLVQSGNWSEATGLNNLTWLGRDLWRYAHLVNP